MYTPTHTRFGPFVVGALLACNVRHANKNQINSIFGTLTMWVLTIMSLVIIFIPCLPADDEVPIEGQFFATTALRTLAAASVAFLLYRTLVPTTHPWHWSMLTSFLSLSLWTPIAEMSYCSYLIHFRILMELSFRTKLRDFFQIRIPDHFDDKRVSDWLVVLGQLICWGSLVSFTISIIMHHCIEKPCLRLSDHYLKTQIFAIKESKDQ